MAAQKGSKKKVTKRKVAKKFNRAIERNKLTKKLAKGK